jgi:hypothetical protein
MGTDVADQFLDTNLDLQDGISQMIVYMLASNATVGGSADTFMQEIC